jgi:hypothetical protein
MIELISPPSFELLVMQNYRFLIDDYGFTLNKKGDWLYSLESQNARVTVLAEHASRVSVALEPIGEGSQQLLRKNIFPLGISVVVISMCLDKNLGYRVVRIANDPYVHNIPVELERQAGLLRKYCTKMILGDFSDWAEIQNCMHKRSQEFLHIDDD